MKMKVEMKFNVKNPLFVKELDVPANDLMEAKFQAFDLAKKLAWYEGHKNTPKSVNIYKI